MESKIELGSSKILPKLKKVKSNFFFYLAELKETMARVGADLKQRIIDSVKSTWNTVNQLATFGRAEESLEQEVDKVIEKQLEREKTESSAQCLSESFEGEVNAGKVNMGRRVDYVLQEAPLESFNEYVSALISHVIYW